MRVLADRKGDTRELLSRRLAAEFVPLPAETVRRCVADVLACVAHLGVDPTPPLVERMARERLTGMVKSQPPSGRAAPRDIRGDRRRDRSSDIG